MGEQLVIVGDCGGTNTRLVLYSIVPNASSPSRGERAPGALIFKKRYKNEDFREFKEIVSVFLKESGIDILPKVACLACAGPIVNNTVDFTNLKGGWFISGSDLQSFFGIEYVQLINDFLAMGYGVLTLNTSECLKVNEALPQEGGVIAVIGAGTGLGECFLTQDPDNKKYTCFPSEGGHCDWSPHNELECELLNYARKKYNHRNRISAERIISGNGLSLIYEFLSNVKFPGEINQEVYEEWKASGAQKSSIIAKYAKTCSLCRKSMDVFFNAYASETGNAMLKWLPTGGFYITGGIGASNLEYFTIDGKFLKTATDKGRVSDTIKRCPIYVAKVDDVGERGAHLYAFELLKKKC